MKASKDISQGEIEEALDDLGKHIGAVRSAKKLNKAYEYYSE